MVGGDSVALEQYEILIVFGNLKVAFDKVGEGVLYGNVAVRLYTENEVFPFFKRGFYVVKGEASLIQPLLSCRLGVEMPVLRLDLLFFIG